MRRFISVSLLVVGLLLPSPSSAQGTTGSINGAVSDKTGAILPGVTVTATGAAIMGAQVALANEQGQYRFPALPPGTYRLEYQLAGFTTVVRDGIIVSVGFTATVNLQLELATLAETVTVTGNSPVVDTQNSNIQTNFTQEMIRSLPNARDIWALIAVAPGTTMSSFDVGGSRAGTQTGYQAYGRGGQVRVQVDGANATEDTGGTGYFNYGAFDEVQIGTDSNDASMPTPGVQINAVVKSGGNQFKGDLYLDFENEKMQGKNVTEELKRLGVGEGTRITTYYDPNFNFGGPIRKDKFWYFFSVRDQRIGTTITGFPADRPSNFEFLTKLENFTDKLTYQINQNNKLSQFFEIRRKLQPYRSAASTTYTDAVYKQESISSYGTLEWNSVVSRSFFFNTRLSSWGYNWPNYAYGANGLQDGIQPRRFDNQSGNSSGGAREDKLHRRRWQLDWSGTLFKDDFLGGNHTIRMGLTSETEGERDLDNGWLDEYEARFDSPAGQPDFTRPWRVRIENSPRLSVNHLTHRGAYIQDQFVLGPRATINVGIRWDYYRVFYPDEEILAGRFRDFFYAGVPLPNGYSIPASFPSFKVPANDSVLRFPSGLAPRFGIAYDLRGNGKTVLKANWGRYQANPGPQNFSNPLQTTQYTFEWLDLNGDRQFTLNEFGPFVSSTGGAGNTISPNLEQEFTDDASFFVEQELIANLGVRAGYVKKTGGNNWQSVEMARLYGLFSATRSVADLGPDGLAGTTDDGPAFTVFDIPTGVTVPASRTDLRNQPLIESWDQNIDIALNKRMSNRWSLLASFLYNWDHNQGAPQNPNQERFNENDLTNWAFKFFGTYLAPWSIAVNPVLRYQQGVNYSRQISVTLRTGTLNYMAEAPGTYRSDNVAIFDLAGERRFRLPGGRSLDVFLAAFNLLNSDVATARDQIVGRRTADVDGTLYPYARFLRPTGILPPRVFRIGVKALF
ncbi:MAG: carboxypeptidase regulatory-like domain-containing protein [Vicinamibacterales bacterium]